MSLSLRDALIEVANNIGWCTIDALCDGVDGLDAIDWMEILKSDEHAFRQMKKIKIRQELRGLKDPTGFPAFASVVRGDGGTGQNVRMYKQEALFDIDDYRQVVDYWVGHTNRGAYMARIYRDRAASRLGVQLPLDFNMFGMGDQAPPDVDEEDEE